MTICLISEFRLRWTGVICSASCFAFKWIHSDNTLLARALFASILVSLVGCSGRVSHMAMSIHDGDVYVVVGAMKASSLS
jgi:hypothetical protein